LGNGRGLRAWERNALDADAQAQLARILSRLRGGAVAAARYRIAGTSTSKGHKQRQAIERQLARQGAVDRDLAQTLTDLADRLGPHPGDKPVAYRETLLAHPPAPSAPSVAATRNPDRERAAPAP